jgi:hypothetical protein
MYHGEFVFVWEVDYFDTKPQKTCCKNLWQMNIFTFVKATLITGSEKCSRNKQVKKSIEKITLMMLNHVIITPFRGMVRRKLRFMIYFKLFLELDLVFKSCQIWTLK